MPPRTTTFSAPTYAATFAAARTANRPVPEVF